MIIEFSNKRNHGNKNKGMGEHFPDSNSLVGETSNKKPISFVLIKLPKRLRSDVNELTEVEALILAGTAITEVL